MLHGGCCLVAAPWCLVPAAAACCRVSAACCLMSVVLPVAYSLLFSTLFFVPCCLRLASRGLLSAA